MIDPRQNIMQILNGMNTERLVEMLGSQGIHVDLPGGESAAAAMMTDDQPLESFNDVKVKFGKTPGRIFDKQAIDRAQIPVLPARQPMPEMLTNPPPEYLDQAGGMGGGID